MEKYQSAALAPSTRPVYQVGLRHHNPFCKTSDIESFPVSQQSLSLFATHLPKSVSYKTIKLYIATIKFHNIELGLKDRVLQMQQPHILLRCIKRKLGTHGLHKPRLPKTLPTMKILHSYLKESPFRHQRPGYVIGCIHSSLLCIFAKFRVCLQSDNILHSRINPTLFKHLTRATIYDYKHQSFKN